MRASKVYAWLAVVGLYFNAGLAIAADGSNVVVAVGIKEWVSNWTSWHADNVFYDSGSTTVSEPISSATQSALTPQITVIFLQSFLLSASYLAPATYHFNDAVTGLPIAASRNELDFAGGYYLLPGLALTAGYKQVEQNYGQGAFKWTGPTLGLAASATLISNWSLYGTYAYGFFKLKVPEDSADAATRTSFDATYSVGEFGLAYNLSVSRLLKSVRLAVGYRAQLLSTRGYTLSVSDGGAAPILVAPSERDFTQGPTVSLTGTF